MKTKKQKSQEKTDLYVQNEGTIFLLHPLSKRGERWIEEHIPDNAMTFGKAIVIEHRYIGAIVDGAQADGLRIE